MSNQPALISELIFPCMDGDEWKVSFYENLDTHFILEINNKGSFMCCFNNPDLDLNPEEEQFFSLIFDDLISIDVASEHLQKIAAFFAHADDHIAEHSA